MSTLTQRGPSAPLDARAPDRLGPGPRTFAQTHTLPLFFGLAFFFSWLIWVPLALDHLGLVPLDLDEGFVQIVRLFGTLGPALAATVIAVWTGGRPGLRALWGQLGRWRVCRRWYVAATLVFPALLLAAAGLYRLLPGAAPLPVQALTVGNLAITVVVMTVSVIGEEMGWRGLALPLMLRRWPALAASVALGAIWTAWHIPFWIVLDELARFGWAYWLINWVFITAVSIYLTWLMQNTGHSVLLAVLVHWTLNIVSVGLLPLTTVVPAYMIFAGLTVVVALVVGARLRPSPQARLGEIISQRR